MFFSRVKIVNPNSNPNTQITIPYSSNWCPLIPKMKLATIGQLQVRFSAHLLRGSNAPPSKSNIAAAANFLLIPRPADLAMSNETLMNFPPKDSFFSWRFTPAASGLRHGYRETSHTCPLLYGACTPDSGNEPASARVISLNLKETRDSSSTGTLPPRRDAPQTLGGSGPPRHYPLCRATREGETMFYNISLIAGQIF